MKGHSMASSGTRKFLLDESRIPTSWYNIAADLPVPLPPPLHPGTGQPIGPDDLAPLFPISLIAQEVSQEREIEIPDPVRDVYRLWRPTPLYRAANLEQALESSTSTKERARPEVTSQTRLCRRPGTTSKRA